jgi:hypothetical protein
MRLVILVSVALLTGATSRANAAQPTTYVYVLLGGFAGADGYVDSSGMLLLARRIAWIPHTWVESYNWADWVTAANRIWGACVGTSGYGSIRIGIRLGAWLPLPFDAADLGAFQGQIVH